jgi:hypothetical protein
MDRRLVAAVACLLAVAPTLIAQSVQVAPPSSLDLRLGAYLMPTTRIVSTSEVTTATASQTMTGLELLWRSTSAGGVRARYSSGGGNSSSPAAVAQTIIEAALLMGDLGFSVEIGLQQRRERLLAGDSTLRLVRAGIRSEFRVGTSGVTVGFGGSHFREPKIPDDGEEVHYGFTGEAWAVYAIPGYPAFVQAGFRREIRAMTGEVKKPEEMSTLMFGIGFHRGLR